MQFRTGNPSWALLPADQLVEALGHAPAQQFLLPFFVEPAALVEYEEHLEGGVAEQHIRRLLRRCDKVFLAIGHLQRLQQTLAGPALSFPLAGIGEEVVGLFRLARQQAQIVGLVHDSSIVARNRRRAPVAV